MIVTDKSAIKLGKKSDVTSVVWVQCLAPPTHADFKMQLYPHSHDFSILSVLTLTCPRDTTFLDLGITELTSPKLTVTMFLAFSSMNRSPVFTTSSLDDEETLTSDHGESRSPNVPEVSPSIDFQTSSTRSVPQTFLDSITSSASKPLLHV